MPIKVKQEDGSVLIVKLTSQLAAINLSEKLPSFALRALEEYSSTDELPMCKDCGKNKVTGKGMKYCEPCK